MCVLPALLPIRILAFYAESWSLYTHASGILSKWSGFYSKYPLWVCTHDRCIPLDVGRGWVGVVVLHIRIKLWKTRGRGGYKWVSLCWCARFNLGTRYLLRQAQYEAQLPVQFPSLQGTWDSSSVEHPGVRTHNCYCDTVFNPTFNMQNGFIHFRGHDSTQSGKYDLGLLAYHPINREEKRRKIVPLLIAMLSLIVLLDFFSLR